MRIDFSVGGSNELSLNANAETYSVPLDVAVMASQPLTAADTEVPVGLQPNDGFSKTFALDPWTTTSWLLPFFIENEDGVLCIRQVYESSQVVKVIKIDKPLIWIDPIVRSDDLLIVQSVGAVQNGHRLEVR